MLNAKRIIKCFPYIDTLLSGSPILQNGKLIGAVIHVFLQNPKMGYGIFLENMLKAGEEALQAA